MKKLEKLQFIYCIWKPSAECILLSSLYKNLETKLIGRIRCQSRKLDAQVLGHTSHLPIQGIQSLHWSSWRYFLLVDLGGSKGENCGSESLGKISELEISAKKLKCLA